MRERLQHRRMRLRGWMITATYEGVLALLWCRDRGTYIDAAIVCAAST